VPAGYIISAYKRPDLLVRLVRVLGASPVAIHVDRKSDIFDEVRAALSPHANVTFLPRHDCHWGLFGHVEASLEGMAWFQTTPCDHAVLLTAQCYPIRTLRDIERDLDDLGGRSVIEHAAFPKAEWLEHERGGYRRLDHFFFRHPRRQAPREIKLWTRKPPHGLHPYGGAGYWCLSRACVDHVLSYLRRYPGVKRFFATTFIPDETFFHTILANSHLRDRLIDSCIHHAVWSPGIGSPAVLTPDDLPAAMASGAWFARKFEDHATLDLVDALREGGGAAAVASSWRRKAGPAASRSDAGRHHR
jgi:hypothetical protein